MRSTNHSLPLPAAARWAAKQPPSRGVSNSQLQSPTAAHSMQARATSGQATHGCSGVPTLPKPPIAAAARAQRQASRFCSGVPTLPSHASLQRLVPQKTSRALTSAARAQRQPPAHCSGGRVPKNEPRTHCTGRHAPKNEPRTHCTGRHAPKNEPRTHCTGRHAPKNEPHTHCRGVSTRQGALQPLWGVKKAGNSALPITATHTPCVSRNSSVRGMSSTCVQAWGPEACCPCRLCLPDRGLWWVRVGHPKNPLPMHLT